MSLRRLGLVIVGVALLKWIVALVVFQDIQVWEDGDMAANLVQTGSMFHMHHGVANHTFGFPVYASLVAAIYAAFGVHPRLIVGLNLALNSLNAWVLIGLFGRLFDRLDVPDAWRPYRSGIIAASVVAFLLHPVTSYYAMNNVHPLPLDMLMLYLPLLLVLRAADRDASARDLALLGVGLGLALLTRTTLAACLLPFVWLTWSASGRRLALRRGLVVVGIALAIGLPWLVRNYRTDSIVGYTSTTGEILWKGSLAGSEGSNYLANGRSYLTALSVKDEDALSSMSVDGQNRWFMGKFLEEVREDPPRTLDLFVSKLRNFFWFRPGIGSDYGAAMRSWIPVYEVVYVTVLLAAMASLIAVGRPLLPFFSVIVALGVFQSVFYVETRHRVVIEPLLFFVAMVPVPAAITGARRWLRSAFIA